MKKVIAFVGSPRKNGNTATLVEEAAKGARDAGAEVKVYYLEELQFKGCQGCSTCRQKPECEQQDDFTPIINELSTADGVIIGSPIYMWQVSSQVKKLFDRFYPLTGADLKPRFGTKKTLMLYSQANPNADGFQAYFEHTGKMLSSLFGLNIVDTIVVSGAVTQDMAKSNPCLMVGAFTAGRNLVG
jgi:multimeric flavodoxin WrbA